MASYHGTGQKSPRPFIVTPYRCGPDGRLEPAVPGSCPLGPDSPGACDLRFHHARPRKTGPPFPLMVYLCRRHELAFTLYPPGFAPYQRVAVQRLAPSGGAILSEAECPATDDRLRRDFEGTLFEAALEGATGSTWARDSEAGPVSRWWSTQGRQLDRALVLVGAAPDEVESVREQIAVTLGVETLRLRESARRVSEGGGYRGKAEAIFDVLGALRRDATRALRLLSAAHLARLWGKPRAWLEERNCLRDFAFP